MSPARQQARAWLALVREQIRGWAHDQVRGRDEHARIDLALEALDAALDTLATATGHEPVTEAGA